MNIPLYQIEDEFQELLYLMEEGEIEEEDFNKFMEELNGMFKEKAVNIAGLFLSLEADSKSIKEAEQKMRKRRESLEKNSKRLREYLLKSMLNLQIKEVKTAEYLVKLRKSPPSVGISSESMIPNEFKEIVETIKIDKMAIKTAIKAGKTVPGAVLQQGYSLAVK